MKTALFAAISATILSACTEAPVVPQKVLIEVPVPCLKPADLPKPPDAMVDSDLAKLDDYRFVIQLAQDRIEYRRYSAEAQAIIGACVK